MGQTQQSGKPGDTMLKTGDALTKGCGCIIAIFAILIAISAFISMFR